MKESEEGRDLYKKTHADLHPGEQHDREYFDSYDPTKCYGIPTPHDNTGKATRKTMRWLHTDISENKRTPLAPSRVERFRERTQPQLGKVHDP